VIEVGMRFETEMEDGSVVLVRVIDVDDKTVTVDGNHELAGRDIRFDLEVIEVRQATEAELQHGHAHSADGHCQG
jgi:FKBP-type peptidyl-prolyl cis-trans isomerase SlyD